MSSHHLLLALAFVVGCGGRTVADFGDPVTGAPLDAATSDAATVDTAVIVADASPPLDADPPIVTDTAPAPRLACAFDSCDVASEECCVTPMEDDTIIECVPRGGCFDGIVLSCTSAASCGPGQTCCLRAGMDLPTATCGATCAGRENYRLCASDAECAMGQRCRMVEGGIRVCFGPGGT